MRLVAASTRDGALVGGGRGDAQKFGQRRCAGMMHSRPHRQFDGLHAPSYVGR